MSQAAKPLPKPEPETTETPPKPELLQLSRVRFQTMADAPSETSWSEVTWLSIEKGWVLEADLGKRVVYVRNARRQNPMRASIPFENVSSWVEKPTAEEIAKLPPTLLTAVQTAPPPYYRGPSVPEPTQPEAPKDLRPTVSLRDLGASAMAYYQEHGHVMVGGREHRVVP